MNPSLIDTHSHLHFPGYDADRTAVFERMRDKNIWTVTIGTTAHTSSLAVQLAEAHEDVWAAVGHHPEHLTSSYIPEDEPDAGTYSIKEIERIASSSTRVVAIGETGLDFFRIDEGRDVIEAKHIQEIALREHIALAQTRDLPVVLHCREALARLAEVIQDERTNGRTVRGVVHCFTGTWDEAKPLLDLGLHLSFTGIITFPMRKNEDPERSALRVIERMPLDRILVETDAPFLTPHPHRGDRNEPTYVEYVAKKIAELRGASYEEIASCTTENARSLFSI